MKTIGVSEIETATGLDGPTWALFIERAWIIPYSAEVLDEEDLARIRLIQELRGGFSVNDDAVGLVLHLVDQLYCLRATVRKNTR